MKIHLADLPRVLQEPDVLRQILSSPSKSVALIHYQGATYSLSLHSRPDLEEADYSDWPPLGER